MTKGELIKLLREFCVTYFDGKNYKFETKNIVFADKTENSLEFKIGFHAKKNVDFGSPTYPWGFDLEPFIVLINYQVDNIFKKVSKRYKKLEIESTALFSFRVGDYFANPDFEEKSINNFFDIKIYSPDDFEKRKEMFDAVFLKCAFPFFEKYSSYEEQFKVLQFDPTKKFLLSQWPAERLMKAIILGKLIGADGWHLLFSKYEPLFKSVYNQDSLEEFYDLRKELLG